MSNLLFVIFHYGESSVKNTKCMTPMSVLNLKAALVKRHPFDMSTVTVAVSNLK